MTTPRLPAPAFELAWNQASSIQEVADLLGMKHVTVRTHANYLRKTGTRLKCLCCHCPEKGK